MKYLKTPYYFIANVSTRISKVRLFNSDAQEIKFNVIVMVIALSIYIILSTLRQLQ